MTTIAFPSHYRHRAFPRPATLHVKHHGANVVERAKQICGKGFPNSEARNRMEKILRERYGADRRQRLSAATKSGKSERTLINWMRGENLPSLFDALNFIAATNDLDLARALLEPFGFTIARTTDLEAIETLRAADQLQPFLTGSLPGLKALIQAWEALNCQTPQKDTTSLKPPAT